jgi:hypothetical protein
MPGYIQLNKEGFLTTLPVHRLVESTEAKQPIFYKPSINAWEMRLIPQREAKGIAKLVRATAGSDLYIW